MTINYNEPVTKEHIDTQAYLKKFEFVDKFKELRNPHPKYMAAIRDDPTMFSYMFFKDNNNNPLKLFDYQDIILNDKHDRKYFRSANQTGKSLTFNVKGAHNIVKDHGHTHNEAIVSKSLAQATYQMRRVKQLLNTMNVDWKDESQSGTKVSDNMSLITYNITDHDKALGYKTKYTNLLACCPCTEGLLGYDLHDLDMDEMEYWVDVDLEWFYNQIAQPRLYATKGNILIMSNPNGSDNFCAELENQTVRNSSTKRFHTYVYNFLDRPGNTQEEYDQLKHELSRQQFESTVAAIRSISSLSYFSQDEINRSYDQSLSELNMVGKQPFFFLDVGAKHDKSVLCGGYIDYPDPEDVDMRFAHVYIPLIHEYPEGYPISRVAGLLVNESDGWHYEKSVKEHLQEWRVGGIQPVFGYDITGNQGMAALFDSMKIDAQDITFTGVAKSGMYQRFKYFMEKGLLHRIKHKSWESQASKVVAVKGTRGYLLINAASHTQKGGKSEDVKLKRIPDDCMDSTAGLIQLCDPMNYVEPSMKKIGGGCNNDRKNYMQEMW